MARALIFDTHPIQYRSPVFRELFKRASDFKVFYFSDAFNAKKWWFNEVDKIPEQTWGIPLREGFPSEVLGTEKKSVLGRYRLLAKTLKEERPSAVLIYGYYLPEHWMLWVLCQRMRIDLVFVGETFSRGGSWIRRSLKMFLQPLFFRKVSRVISIGNRSYEFYRSLGLSDQKIVRAKYCVDTSFFSASETESRETRSRVRKEWGIREDSFVLLFVGRLFERKRPRDVIAIHRAAAEMSRGKLVTVFVGNGPLEEPIRKEIRPGESILVVGFKNQREARDCYLAADCLIVSSEFESWGLVVNEAFAMGLTAIVTDTCGVANDLVVPNETGFVYPVGEVSMAAQAVQKLVVDRESANRLKRRAQAKVNAEFTTASFAESIGLATYLLTPSFMFARARV